MKTYTIIAECEGGTFLSQHHLKDLGDLMRVWFEHIPTPLSSLLWNDENEPVRKELFDSLDREMVSLVPVNGLKSVWAGYLSINESDVFVHVIETSTQS